MVPMPEVSDPDDVDPEKLAALEERAAELIRDETERTAPEAGSLDGVDRVANVVARAHTDTLIKDTLALTVARMWATLATLLVPLFVAFVRQRHSDNPPEPGSQHRRHTDDT